MPVSTSLRARVPGQTVISAILAAQLDVPPRSLTAKICGVSPLADGSRRLYRAALGELAVGEMLDQLGTRWDILHAIPAGHDQIDHLVIGPPGVFVLTTENYPGKEVRINGEIMTVDGREVDDIQAAVRLAASVSEQLSAAAGRTVDVTPIMVVIESGKFILRKQPAGVTVVVSKNLLRMLTRLDRALAGVDVAYISDVAEKDSTWGSDFESAQDALELSSQFALLRAQVRDATQSRIFWAIIGFVIISCGAWASTLSIVERLLAQ